MTLRQAIRNDWRALLCLAAFVVILPFIAALGG